MERNRKDRNGGVLDTVAELFDLPADLVAGLPHLEMMGSRQLYLDGYYKSIAFGSGMCKLCKSCDPNGCRQPEKAIPSMEACGIDVFATGQAFGLDIHTLKCPDEKRNHFGLILVE